MENSDSLVNSKKFTPEELYPNNNNSELNNKNEPKKDEPKKDEPKKEEPKKESPPNKKPKQVQVSSITWHGLKDKSISFATKSIIYFVSFNEGQVSALSETDLKKVDGLNFFNVKWSMIPKGIIIDLLKIMTHYEIMFLIGYYRCVGVVISNSGVAEAYEKIYECMVKDNLV
jgi:hypothetical protein